MSVLEEVDPSDNWIPADAVGEKLKDEKHKQYTPWDLEFCDHVGIIPTKRSKYVVKPESGQRRYNQVPKNTRQHPRPRIAWSCLDQSVKEVQDEEKELSDEEKVESFDEGLFIFFYVADVIVEEIQVGRVVEVIPVNFIEFRFVSSWNSFF